MIEYIKGEIVDLSPTYAVVEAGGIGYMVNISLITYSEMMNQKSMRLYIYESIREDAHTLFGFLSKDERELFLLLISVSGVGASTARMILSSYSASELQDIIASGNVNALKNVKGIGLKSAQRIIVDLKDKVGKVVASGENIQILSTNNEKREEAVAALVMLGFQQAHSAKAVEKLLRDEPDLVVAKLIKKALQML
jgi:Holliday junction DNA helicase RuvA